MHPLPPRQTVHCSAVGVLLSPFCIEDMMVAVDELKSVRVSFVRSEEELSISCPSHRNVVVGLPGERCGTIKLFYMAPRGTVIRLP